LFLVNQFPAEHSLCEKGTVLPGQVTEGTAVKKWHKEKTLQQRFCSVLTEHRSVLYEYRSVLTEHRSERKTAVRPASCSE
jgi:hypothetical protein